MSDYIFMLESHLTPGQIRVVTLVQEAAAAANLTLFLSGGTMRDMLGGFPILGVDFTVEGNAVKFAKALAQKTGAELVRVDDHRKTVRMTFPGNIRSEIGMARQEKFAKPGAKPAVQPATIHEDLRGRDFTINSIALSLTPASRGLLLDPNNGIGDLHNKELRTISNYTLYDDPVRLLRMLRLRVRLDFAIADRTRMQYENAREAELESKIVPEALLDELRSIAEEPNPGEVLRVLEEEKLVPLFFGDLDTAKLNQPGFQKLAKARQLVPHGVDLKTDNLALFLFLLTEKMSPKERASFLKASGLDKSETDRLQKLEPKAKKLEKELLSATLQKPSRVYNALSKAAGDAILFLLIRSSQRLVLDRLRNYLQKYVPAAQEVNEKDVATATGLQPGTPKFQKAMEEAVNSRLDARPKKIVVPPEPDPATLPPSGPMGRGPMGRGPGPMGRPPGQIARAPRTN